jgi:hypothetical protein
MIIDPKGYFKIDYKKVLKEKGLKAIPIVLGYLIMRTGEISADVIHLIISYSKKEEGKKDKEKGGE